MAFTTEMLGDPAAPSSALWGAFCSHIWVLNTVRHTGTFSNRRPARPLAERLYRFSLTHFPVYFPSWLNQIMSGRPGAARGHSQVGHREAAKGSARRTGPGQPHFLAPGLLSKGQTSHSSPLLAFLFPSRSWGNHWPQSSSWSRKNKHLLCIWESAGTCQNFTARCA